MGRSSVIVVDSSALVAILEEEPEHLDFEIVAFDRSYSDAALEAYARFGKGIDPKARLNMGDCASYALSMSLGAPLLFKGNDFVHTDVTPCL